MAAGKYTLAFQFLGGISPSQRAVFDAVSARFSQIITAPLPKVRVNGVVTEGTNVTVQGVPRDGPGGILGAAGPTFLRPPTMGRASYLPCAGSMILDRDDLSMLEARGMLYDVIFHETLHLVGAGTVWARKGILAGSTTPNPTLRGLKGETEYGTLRHAQPTPVPVENTGGPGTALSHLRESVFHDEIQTGWASAPGVKSPLSRTTLALLSDIGYSVDMAQAEPFSLEDHLLMAETGRSLERFVRPHTVPLSAFTIPA